MADKTKSIKSATDKELEELILRLRKESELQYLIGDIKRKSTPSGLMSYEPQHVSTEEPIESLYHFGILGMKWGRRRAQGSKVSSKNTNKDPDSEDQTKKDMLKKKNVRTMSNSELKTLNERLQLERQYKDLTKSETSAGKKFVMDVLTGAAKQTASVYISKYMSKGLDKLLVKAVK